MAPEAVPFTDEGCNSCTAQPLVCFFFVIDDYIKIKHICGNKLA